MTTIWRTFTRCGAISMLLLASPALAGRITAELDQTEGSTDDAFELTVSIEGELDGDLVTPEVPGLIIEQRGHSQRMTISNGHRVSEVSVMYVVRAQQNGEFTIPSISAMLDGEQESTLPLTLKINGGSQQSSQAQQNKTSPGTSKGAAEAAKKSADTGGVFIERECGNMSPYVGEQVVCNVRIFHRGNLNGGQRPGVNSADFRRFSIEGEARYQKVVNGQRYEVIELRDVVVPTKSGTIDLPPFVLEARVLTFSKQRNPLDKFLGRLGGGVFNFDMSFTEEKQVSIKSEPTTFTVKPLPEDGKPAGFQGLVGAYALSATLGKSPVSTGDTTTVTITLNGEGLLDTLADPSLDLKAIGKVYPDKPEYKETITPDTGVRSSKTFRYAVVPEKAGTYSLGKVEVPAFNPTLGRYVVLTADLGTLMVEQGDAKETPLAVGQGTVTADKNAVEVVGSDLQGQHASSRLDSQQTITNTFVFILLTTSLTPWLFSFSFFGLQALKQRREGSAADLRSSRAFRVYENAMADVAKLVVAGNQDEAVAAAHQAFRELVGAKANKHGAAFAARELDTQLATLGASESIRTEAARIIAVLEQNEFSGRRLTAEQVNAALRDLDGVAHAMETLC